MHSSIKDKGRPDAADGSLLNGMKANISEADVSLNAVHEAEGSASGQPPAPRKNVETAVVHGRYDGTWGK